MLWNKKKCTYFFRRVPNGGFTQSVSIEKFRPWHEETRLCTRTGEVGTTNSVRGTKKRICLCLDRARSNSAWKQKSLRGRIVKHSNHVFILVRVLYVNVGRRISAVNTRCSVCVCVCGEGKKNKRTRVKITMSRRHNSDRFKKIN